MPDFPAPPESLYPFFFPTPPITSPDSSNMSEIQARERLGWYFYLTEISLHRLNRRISDEILHQDTLARQSVYEALADALPHKEREVENWFSALPTPMSLQTDAIADDICKFVLRGHLHNLYEVIYWPFVAKYLFSGDVETDGSPSDEGLQGTARVKELAKVGLAFHIERIRVNKPGFMHRHHGTWGLIRSCTRSALVLLKAAELDLVDEDWASAVKDVITLNEYWQSQVVDSAQHLQVLQQGLDRIEGRSKLP